MPFTTEISGIGAAQFTGSEYANPQLLSAFITSLSQFYQLKTGTATLTTADLANIQNQVNFLTQVAQNGVAVNVDSSDTAGSSSSGDSSSPTNVYFLTPDMADILNNLFKSLAPNGNLNALTLTDLNNFRTNNPSDIQNIFVTAAREFLILPAATPSAVPSAISTDPTTAAAQIARIYTAGKVYDASTLNQSATTSLQSYTELEYIETANEVINSALGSLQNALLATQSSLNNLNQLQQLHNDITVNSRSFTLQLGNQSNVPKVTLNSYVATYEHYTSAQLKQALVPQLNSEFLPFSLPSSDITISAVALQQETGPNANPEHTDWGFRVTIKDPSKYYAFNTSTNTFLSNVPQGFLISGYYVSAAGIDPTKFTTAQIQQIVGDGYNGVQQFPLLGTLSALSTLKLQLTRQRGSLSALLVTLAAQTPASVLNDPLKRSQALLGQVSTVYGDLVNNLGSTVSTTPIANAEKGVRSWIMDNYQTFASADATAAGQIQQNITNAITAAQSSNDTQSQEVQNSLQVFEQYYKSAAAVLTQLSQIIQKMADNIKT